jgi:hypothetical protein
MAYEKLQYSAPIEAEGILGKGNTEEKAKSALRRWPLLA